MANILRTQDDIILSIAAVRFLLKEGFKFILTERFCQDVVEEYFGYQHAIGQPKLV